MIWLEILFLTHLLRLKRLKRAIEQLKLNCLFQRVWLCLRSFQGLEAQAMHGQIPVVWDRADDFQIYDKWGNVWLDFTSTIFVANAGHANKRIIKGLRKATPKATSAHLHLSLIRKTYIFGIPY